MGHKERRKGKGKEGGVVEWRVWTVAACGGGLQSDERVEAAYAEHRSSSLCSPLG